MGGTANNWRTIVDGDDWLRNHEKRLLHEERRSSITHASDLLGPGYDSTAVLLDDWSANETYFNGLWYSNPGAANAPDPGNGYTGQSIIRPDGSGIEVAVSMSEPPITWTREAAVDAAGIRTWGAWVQGAGGGGGGGSPTGPAGGDLTGSYPNPEIAAGAVGSAEIANGAVTNLKLATDSVDSSKIINGSVATVDLADGAVTSVKIADGTITSADLAPSTVSDLRVDVQDEGVATVTDVTAFNFVGAGVTATASGTTAVVTIPGGGGASDTAGPYKQQRVRVGALTNVNIAAPGATIDGIALAAGDRVLLTAQTAPAQNGVWVWNGAAAAMTRATDADTVTDLLGAFIVVTEGTNAGREYKTYIPSSGTLDTTAVIVTFERDGGWYGNPFGIAPLDGNGEVPHQNLPNGLILFAKVVATTSIGGGSAPGGVQTIDGYTTGTGDRVLLTAQANPQFNGIYGTNTGATWSRVSDLNAWTEAVSALVAVEQGSTYADSLWLCTADAGGTIDTTPMLWKRVDGVSGGNAGGPMDTWAAVGADQNITLTTPVDLTNLTATVTSNSVTDKFLVVASLDVSVSDASTYFTGQLVVDGAAQTGAITVNGGLRGVFAQNWIISGVAPGARVFKMIGSNFVAGHTSLVAGQSKFSIVRLANTVGTVVLDSYTASCTSALVPVPAALTNVPGLSATVTVTSTAERFLVTATFDVSSAAGNAALILGDLYVGTTAQAGELISTTPVAGTRGTNAQTWIVTGVTPGNVVFKMMAMDYSATNGANVNATHSKMTIVRLAATGAVSGGGTDTGWVPVTLINGWTNYGAPFAPAAYRKVGNKVKLRGLIKSGTLTSTMFTLPPDCRPTYQLLLPAIAAQIFTTQPTAPVGAHLHGVLATSGRLDISTAGNVFYQTNDGTNDFISLDAVEFYID